VTIATLLVSPRSISYPLSACRLPLAAFRFPLSAFRFPLSAFRSVKCH
jgi:hypothetical protein